MVRSRFSGSGAALACSALLAISTGCAPAKTGEGSVCSGFSYSAWGDCQADGTQTRTVLSSLPSGCTGGSPETSQACTYAPPAATCSSFTYSDWGACQPDSTQTRTVLTASPSGCTGGSPVTSQACTYVPPAITCSSFTYSGWGACRPDSTQARTVLTASPDGCTGGSPVTSQACTYVPPAITCSSFTYSDWGACQNGSQARTVLTASPAGCTGGNPVTSQACGGGDCATPPAPSMLVGWAAESGNGVTTTTGGGGATPVTVTTLADLNAAAKGTTPAVIHVKGILEPGTLQIGSNKTIVGLCGAEIHGHVKMSGSANVIVRNLKIVGYNCTDAGAVSAKACSGGEDAISVQGAAHHLWFDHDEIVDGSDGNLDITHAADFITVSWTRFGYSAARVDLVGGADTTGASGHRFSNLIGHNDSNSAEDSGHFRITFHHNWWGQHVIERQPRVRYGQVHLFNNLWTGTGTNYCVGVGVGASIRTENNAFLGVKTPINTTGYVKPSIAASAIASSGNLYTATTGAAPADLNADTVFTPPYAYAGAMTPAAQVEAEVTSNAGPR